MRALANGRARDRIAELARRGYDLVTFWRESTEVLASAVPHYDYPCWYTLDPASLLITSHFHDGLPQYPAKMLRHKYYDEDVNQIADVARSTSGISTLHEATGGNPASSPSWHMNMEMGGDQELIAALRTGGAVWGAVGRYRAPGEPLFNDEDKALLQKIAPDLAAGARMGLLTGEAREPQWPDSPGLVILSENGEVESTTPGVERWLSDLPDGDLDAGRLPTAVHAVAARALRATGRAANLHTGEVALARVLSRSGTWVVLHGTPLASSPRRAAVIVEPAHPARITPLLMSAYGLSAREQELTRLVLRGDSTAQIAQRLVVSPHTVQEHLKKIFEKTGVRSRRELVGKVFFAHYEPRFRDNETRVLHDDPVRGEPFPN
jgi:DNA-binding CsgD family transcriptional regulator